MAVSSVRPFPVSIPEETVTGQKQQASSSSFAEVLAGAIRELNSSQLRAEEAVQKFLTGEIQDVHDVIIVLEEAKLTMQLAVEVRNKVIEAYQEMMRMQV